VGKRGVIILLYTDKPGGTEWRSCLRQCTTNQKVAGSIPDGAIGFFH